MHAARSSPLAGALGLSVLIAFAAILPRCGTDAVGVSACRQIELTRCRAAATCGFTEDEVTRCEAVYRDQCLHGIENTTRPPSSSEAEACAIDVRGAEACAARRIATMAECPGAPVVAGAEGRAPCDVILSNPQLLARCAFVVAPPPPPDAGTGGAPGTGGGAGTGGAGGAGGTGGSGGGSAP